MARGKKRKGKREHRRGYGAVNPNGGTGIDYSEDIAAVNGDNGANDHTEEKGDELSVPLDEVCTARALNDVDDEDDSDESTQGECMGKDCGSGYLIFLSRSVVASKRALKTFCKLHVVFYTPRHCRDKFRYVC